MKKKKYDVALSFAGEDRQYAKELAELLKSGGYSVFYDEFERAELWGKDLYVDFSSVYRDLAHYCVVFMSKHYARKPWTNHERKSAQARAFEEDREYILPVRLDDTEIPGILPTDGYLDLRLMSIEAICQVLVEKLSDTTSQTETTGIPMPAAAESDSGEFALLLTEERKLYFFSVQSTCWDSTEISLELLPESSEDAAFLRSLRKNCRAIVPIRNTLAFALGEDATWVTPREISQTTSGSQTVWKVVLQEDSRGQYPVDNVALSHISPDRIAEMRARRILLDEKLDDTLEELPEHFQNRTGMLGSFNQMALEALIGEGNRFQTPESAIPFLYQSFGHTSGRFKKFARLISVLYLKLSNTVEDVLQLDLELLNPKELQVRFKGRCPWQGIGVEPPIIEVNGICPL